MPLHAPSTHDEFEATDASGLGASGESEMDPGATTVADDAAALEAPISIELNFNAFADDVPPNKHAKRAARYDDPSIQDFADQALELAALRAELKRLTHDYASLQQAVRLRDTWLKTLRGELASAQAQLRSTTHGPTSPLAPTTNLEGSGTIAGVPPVIRGSQVSTLAPKRQLIPVDHEGEPILLCRDIVTIGRTRDNDICIPSRAVSRDHARLLIGPSSVTIVDMGSANGCFVNDEPAKRQKLKVGDVVRIGDRSYRFTGSPASQQ